MSEKKGNLLESVINKEDIAVAFTKILCIHLNVDYQIKNCFISTSGAEQIDNLINECKIKVLKCLNIVATFIFETKHHLGVTNTKFYQLFPTLLPLMMITITKYCKSDNIKLQAETSVISMLLSISSLWKETLNRVLADRDFNLLNCSRETYRVLLSLCGAQEKVSLLVYEV